MTYLVSKDFMIKICLPNLDNKFINNIKLVHNNLEFYSNMDNDIYKFHHKITPHVYIFDGSSITNDIFEFISEYGDTETKIYIYHGIKHNKDSIRYIKKAKHLTHHAIYQHYKQYHNVIQIPSNLINPHIYFNKNINKKNVKIYFLDNENSIPEKLNNMLYPNSKDIIWLFNNHNIRHVQNLGFLPELEKPLLMNSVKYFITNENLDYAVEGVACGCKVLNVKDMSDITEEMVAVLDSSITYTDFIKQKIL